MAMIDDPNQTTLEGLIRKADVVNPQHPGYIEEYKPTSGFFPTGEFMGMPVSKGIQDLIGQIALLGIGGIGSKPSSQVLKKMMSKTPGVKASKDVIEAGRTDIIDKAYTGGRMIRGLTSKPTVAPFKTTSKPTSNIPTNPLTEMDKLTFEYKNLSTEYGVNFNKLKKLADDYIKRGHSSQDSYWWAFDDLTR